LDEGLILRYKKVMYYLKVPVSVAVMIPDTTVLLRINLAAFSTESVICKRYVFSRLRVRNQFTQRTKRLLFKEKVQPGILSTFIEKKKTTIRVHAVLESTEPTQPAKEVTSYMTLLVHVG
jgi:hypothetical protein